MKQAILGTILTVASAFAQSVTIPVTYANLANVPERTLRAALKSASATFSNAGVEIAWIDCTAVDLNLSGHCRFDDPMRFRLTFKNSDSFREETLGFAYPNIGHGNRAAIAYSNVKRFASEHATIVSEELVLAAAVTHELGHLFLWTKEHGHGVMMAKWDKQNLKKLAQRRLGFSSVQAGELRSALESRRGVN